MTTFTIVAKDKSPLGPNEINAGDKISVADGDVFIIDASVDADITFQEGGAGPIRFDIRITDSNSNDFKIKVDDALDTTAEIGNGVDLADVDFELKKASSVNLDIGDNVTLGKFEGSVSGPNTVTIGDGFTTQTDWKFGTADDSLTVGNDATFNNLEAGKGDDTITFGDGATINDFDAKSGDDSVTFGDDLTAKTIKTSDGDDTIRIGKDAQVEKVDGGNGNDRLNTETTGLEEEKIETTLVVCYAAGTHVATPFGPRKIDTLRVGDLVETLDAGHRPVRWLRVNHQSLDAVPDDQWPILVQAGALGENRPTHDLVVSPQHRIFVGGSGQLEGRFGAEFLVPAKALTSLPGVRYMRGKKSISWIHFALDRHQVVCANGCYAESLYLGPMVVRQASPRQRAKLRDIFGPAPDSGAALNGAPARPFLKVREARREIAAYANRRDLNKASLIEKDTCAAGPAAACVTGKSTSLDAGFAQFA